MEDKTIRVEAGLALENLANYESKRRDQIDNTLDTTKIYKIECASWDKDNHIYHVILDDDLESNFYLEEQEVEAEDAHYFLNFECYKTLSQALKAQKAQLEEQKEEK